jgi:hypothetical protein
MPYTNLFLEAVRLAWADPVLVRDGSPSYGYDHMATGTPSAPVKRETAYHSM